MSIDDWQSIEKAPKDGTKILGINSLGQIAVVFWYTHPWTSCWRIAYGGSPDSERLWNGHADRKAVAWKPIPNVEEQKQILAKFSEKAP